MEIIFPDGANSFFEEQTQLSTSFIAQGVKREVIRIISFPQYVRGGGQYRAT